MFSKYHVLFFQNTRVLKEDRIFTGGSRVQVIIVHHIRQDFPETLKNTIPVSIGNHLFLKEYSQIPNLSQIPNPKFEPEASILCNFRRIHFLSFLQVRNTNLRYEVDFQVSTSGRGFVYSISARGFN